MFFGDHTLNVIVGWWRGRTDLRSQATPVRVPEINYQFLESEPEVIPGDIVPLGHHAFRDHYAGQW